MNRSISLACLLAIAQICKAQDIHYNPFSNMPMTINPAYTGMFNGAVRASAMYENRWAATTIPFVSVGAAADMPVFTHENGSYLATGLQYIGTEAPGYAYERSLQSSSLNVSLAWHQRLSNKAMHKKSELGVGVQFVGQSRSINFSAPYFGNEFNIVVFPVPLGSERRVDDMNLNAGLTFAQSTGSKFSYIIGGSANNIVQPSDKSEEAKYQRFANGRNYLATFDARWNPSTRFTISPALLMWLLPGQTNFIAGTEAQYNFGNGTRKILFHSIFIGAWMRSGDAINLTMGSNIGAFRIAAGMDHFLSTLNTSSSFSGMSLQFRYIAPAKAGKKKATRIVACDRF